MSGEGGIGKTNLVFHYASVNERNYDFIIFIDCTPKGKSGKSTDTFDENLKQVNKELCQQLNKAETPGALQAYLVEDKAKYLLILDNVDDVDVASRVTGLLPTPPKKPSGHVLITGQCFLPLEAHTPLQIEGLDDEAACTLVSKLLQKGGWETAKETFDKTASNEKLNFVRAFGRSPFLLKIVANQYGIRNGSRPKDDCESLQTFLQNEFNNLYWITDTKLDSTNYYPKNLRDTTVKTIDAAKEAAKKLNGDAFPCELVTDILQLWSFFEAETIIDLSSILVDGTLLNNFRCTQKKYLAVGIQDFEATSKKAIEALIKHNLLKKTENAKGYYIPFSVKIAILSDMHNNNRSKEWLETSTQLFNDILKDNSTINSRQIGMLVSIIKLTKYFLLDNGLKYKFIASNQNFINKLHRSAQLKQEMLRLKGLLSPLTHLDELNSIYKSLKEASKSPSDIIAKALAHLGIIYTFIDTNRAKEAFEALVLMGYKDGYSELGWLYQTLALSNDEKRQLHLKKAVGYYSTHIDESATTLKLWQHRSYETRSECWSHLAKLETNQSKKEEYEKQQKLDAERAKAEFWKSSAAPQTLGELGRISYEAALCEQDPQEKSKRLEKAAGYYARQIDQAPNKSSMAVYRTRSDCYVALKGLQLDSTKQREYEIKAALDFVKAKPEYWDCSYGSIIDQYLSADNVFDYSESWINRWYGSYTMQDGGLTFGSLINHNPRISSLRLYGCHLSDAAFKVLGESLNNNESITTLALEYTSNVTDQGIASLATGLKKNDKAKLSTLSLKLCSELTAASILDLIRDAPRTLKTIELSDRSPINSKKADIIAAAAKKGIHVTFS